MPYCRQLFILFFSLTFFHLPVAQAEQTLLPAQTPIQANDYQRLPTSREVHDYLRHIDIGSDQATLKYLGRTAGKRPYNLLVLSTDNTFLQTGTPSANKITVMIIASLHGDEPSGAEATQLLIQQLTSGERSDLLQDINFVLFPLANPDGRDTHARYNANNADLNRDFLTVQENESSFIVDAIQRYQPHAVLDIHEASAFKSILGAKEGYLTNFETQFETTSNPNVDKALSTFSEEIFLPALITQVNEQLPAQRYRGAITSLNQPFVRASLSAGVLRNYGGLHGALSILQENRLDNDNSDFDTPHNIRMRTEKQLLGLLAFLELAQTHKTEIIDITNTTRNQWISAEEAKRVTLVADFALDDAEAVVDIPLIEIATGEAVTKPFVNYSAITTSNPIQLPSAYAITAEQAEVASILDKHNIDFEVIHQPAEFNGMRQRIRQIHLNQPINLARRVDVRVELAENAESILLQSGDILVKTNQPMGILLPILLDPRSSSSIFQNHLHRPLLLQYGESFLVPLDSIDPVEKVEIDEAA